MILRILLTFSLLSLTAASAGSALAQGAVETGRYGAWIMHQSADANTKLCFAAAQPAAKEPAGANRGKALLYVSAWPKEGVKTEISIKLGYPIKADTDITVTVGNDAFTLFPAEERAYVADATEELKLIEAMRKGSKLTVQATSARGTATIDTYSLAGLTQALQALATACP